MKGFNRGFLLIVFGVLICAPFLNDRFHFFRFKRLDENRTFHDSLSININKLDHFPKACENYLSDNFSFRTPMIEWNKSVNLNFFRVSPNPEHLIIGKNGRYFIAGEERAVYEGDRQLTPAQLDSFEAEWLHRKAFFQQHNVVPYLIIAPSALEVYPEDLPFNIVKRYEDSRIDQLRKRFQKRLPGILVDLKPVFEKSKQHNLYRKLDNHWNMRAGFAATEELLNRLKRDHFPVLSTSYLGRYKWTTDYVKNGYLGSFLPKNSTVEAIPVPDYQDQAELAENFGFPPPSDFMYPDQFEFHYVHSKPKNKLKLLIIRDSFGDAVFSFLKEGFAETLVIFDSWQYGLNKEIVAAYKPDVVIYITYEAHLMNQIRKKK
jgi:hypothetical protein